MNLSNPDIVNMVITSILDHSEDWTIKLVGGDPVIHRHKSGISIWAYCDKVEFYEPEYAKAIKIPRSERTLLFNAIKQDRVEKSKNIRAKAAERLIRQFTGTKSKSWLGKLFS